MPKVHETAKLHLTLRGVDLTNAMKGWFGGTSSPTFKISAFSPGSPELWKVVKTSGRVDQELNPVWPAVDVGCKELCDCDLDNPIQVTVFDQDKTGADVGAMGSFETTVNALLKKKIEDLNNVDVSKLYTLQEGGARVGMVAVMDVRLEEPPTAKLQRVAGALVAGQKAAAIINTIPADKGATPPMPAPAPAPAAMTPPAPVASPKVSPKASPPPHAKPDTKEKEKDKRDREKDKERGKERDSRDRSRRSRNSRYDSASDSGGSIDDDEPQSRDKSSRSLSPKRLNENSLLHLTLEGVDMANVEGWLGCSDPFFQVDASMHVFEGTTMWQNIHRSEHINDSLNPKWEPVQIYMDRLCQLDLDKAIRVSIYDWEESGKHNPMGHFETTVNEILKAKAAKKGDSWDLSKSFVPISVDGKDMGKIVVVDAYTNTPSSSSKSRRAQVSIPSKLDQYANVRLTLEGVELANVEGWLGCSDPFYQVETPMKGYDGSIIWQSVHRSEHVEDSLNPRWEPAEINIDLLCQLDLDKPLRFSFFDWEESGKHNPMGHFETSLNCLLRSKAEKQGDSWQIAKAFMMKADTGEEFGKIIVVDVSVDAGKRPKGRSEKGKSSNATVIPTKVDKHGALVLTLEGIDMANVEGWFGCSDPFYSINTPVHASDGTTSWNTIYKSEYKADNLNPLWEPAILALEPLCQCDLDKPLRIVVQDWEENGDHKAIGHFDTSVSRLLRSKAERQGDAWDPAKAFIIKSVEGEESGKIVVVDVTIDPKGAKKVKAEPQQSPPKMKSKGPRKKLTEAGKSSSLSLSLEGVELANIEGWFGCSDPFFVISTSLKEYDGTLTWQRVHKSEFLLDTLDPKWKAASVDLALLCQGNYDRPIKISVFDWDESETHNPMGHFITSTQKLYDASCDGGSKEGATAFTLDKDGENFGKLFVVNAEIESLSSNSRRVRKQQTMTEINNDAMLQLNLEGVGLANVDGWFGCSDPFYQIESLRESMGCASWQTVYNSENLEDTLDPKWKAAWIELALLCELDLDRLVKISIFDWEESGEHKPMGSFVTTANNLLDSVAKKEADKWDTSRTFTPVQDGTDFGQVVVVGATIEASANKPADGESKQSAAAKSIGAENSQHAKHSDGYSGDGSARSRGSRSQYSAEGSHSRGSYDSRRSGSPRLSRSGNGSVHSRGSRSGSRSQYSGEGSHSKGSYDSRRSLSPRSFRSGDGSAHSKSSRSGSQYSDEGSGSKGSYDSRRSRSLHSGNSFRSGASSRSKHSGEYSKRSGGSAGSQYSDDDSKRSARSAGSKYSDGNSKRSDRSAGSKYSNEYSKRSDRSNHSGAGGDISPGERSRSDAGSKQPGSVPPPDGSDYGSNLSGSQQSRRSGSSSFGSRSPNPGESKRSNSPGNSKGSHSLGSRSLSPGNSKGSRSLGSRSLSPGNSKGSRSLGSQSLSPGDSKRSFSPGNSQRSRSYSPSGSRRSYSLNGSRRSYSPGGSRGSNGSRSRRSSRGSNGSRSRRSSRGSNNSGSHRSSRGSNDSRSRRSDRSYDSRRSRSYSPTDSRGSRQSARSNDSRRSRSYSPSDRSRGSYDSRRSHSSRSHDSRSRSVSRSQRSYGSRSLSRSMSRRSYSSRSGSRSHSRGSYSRGSYSSRSRSRSPRSDGSKSDVDVNAGLKSSAWEALQSQADVEEEEIADLKFYLTLRGLKLPNVKGWFGKAAPYFQLSAHSVGTSQMWQPVYTSEAIEGELNPQWKPASMTLDLLCAGDLDKRIKVSVHDQNEKTKKHLLVGSFETSANKLIAAKVGGFGSEDNFDEAKTVKLAAEDGKEMGRIVVLSAHADAPKPKRAAVAVARAPILTKERRLSGNSYDSYDSRRSGSRSRRSRSRSRSSYSRSSRGSKRSSWRSYGSRSRSRSRSDYSGSSRRSQYSRSDNSESSDTYGSEVSGSDSDQIEEDPNGLSEDATLHLTLYGVGLANVEGFFGTSDPFIQIAAYMGVPGPQMWQNIFRSEHVADTLDPKFKPMELNLDLLCKRDLDQPIQFSVLDWEETGKHQPMGCFETTVNGLLEAKVFVGENDAEVDTSKAFTAMHKGEVYGSIVVAGVRVENPETPFALKPMVSKDSESVISAKGKKKKKKSKKGRQKKQHQVKFNTHGDELSIGTIESNADEQILGDPKNVFGDENDDDTKSRPWKGALPSDTGLDGFADQIGNYGAMGDNAENDDDSKGGSITNIAEILARVEEADDSDSDGSDSDDSDGSDDDDKDGSDDDEDKDDSEHSKEDENDVMLEMMSSMQQSMSMMASAPNTSPDIEVDLEKFDEMYDQVIVDSKVVAEFEKKLEERARRGKKKDGEDNEDPDLLRDTPRLILFESEKESKKKRGRKKKKDNSKFSQEFIEAMRTVFGDSESEDDGEEEKKEDESNSRLQVSASFVSKRGSESSLFVGDLASESKEEKTEDSGGENDDDMGKSQKSHNTNVSRSIHTKPPPKKRAPRKRKSPKVDPAEIFAAERRRQEGMKILSTSGLKQEMADMKKGLTRKMMERELANLRKATTNKNFSPFDKKPNSTMFDDYNSNSGKGYGGTGGGAAAAARQQAKKAPSNAGLMDHLARNDDLKDDKKEKFDDLATVAYGAATAALPTLADIPTLGNLPANVQQTAGAASKKATASLGALGQTAQSLGAGAGEQMFFSSQNAGDDDSQSQANVGLTGNKPGDAGGKMGLTKGQQSSRRFGFGFGKKKGAGGVQLDDDDDDDGGYLNSEY